MYKGLTEAKRPRRIVTKIEPDLSDHLRRGWLRFWGSSPRCLRLIYPSNTLLSPPFWPVRDQILFTNQLTLARTSSNFDHSRGKKARVSSKFDHTSSKFDHVRGKKPQASSKFDHVRGKKPCVSSKFDHMRGKKHLASSKFDHRRHFEPLT